MIGQTETQRREVALLHRVMDAGLVHNWSLAIDGGAHVGTWAASMAARFAHVLAFEPTFETFGYLAENMQAYPNVECLNLALMDRSGRGTVRQPRPKRTKLTSRFVLPEPEGEVGCVAIDDLTLGRCGLVKFDLEGAEGLAIQGARETIRRDRPVLVVEVRDLSLRYGHSPEGVERMLCDLGYREAFRSGVDRVYVSEAA